MSVRVFYSSAIAAGLTAIDVQIPLGMAKIDNRRLERGQNLDGRAGFRLAWVCAPTRSVRQEHRMINAVGYAAQHSFSRLKRFEFQRANAIGEQNDCEGANGGLATCDGPMVPTVMAPSGGNLYGKDDTFGGYANVLVVRQDVVLNIPAGLQAGLES